MSDYQFVPCKTRYMARKLHPEAVKIAKVEGGYLVFKSHEDYLTWKRQK